MKLNFLKNLFEKKIDPIGLEEVLKKGLITEDEYHRLIIHRHEIALKNLEKKEK